MGYKVLYREFRPQNFSQIVGQDHVTLTLTNAISKGKIAHAYLFCGSRGTGKTSTAKVFAKTLNCLSPKGAEPCGKCVNCLDIQNGNSMDVIEIDAASNRGIDEVREIRESVKFFPSSGKKKVYIIDEVHMLTDPAFNALLKTLEEPPSYMVFILATTEAHKVPLTILSRCQRFDFHRINEEIMCEKLEEIAKASGFSTEKEALKQITASSEGSLRDALSILDQVVTLGDGKVSLENVTQVLGIVKKEILVRLGQYIQKGNIKEAINLLEEIYYKGQDLKLFINSLIKYFRENILLILEDEDNFLQNNLDKILKVLERLNWAEQEMRWSSQPKVLLEMALIYACMTYQNDLPLNIKQADFGEEIFLRLKELENKWESLNEKINSIVNYNKTIPANFSEGFKEEDFLTEDPYELENNPFEQNNESLEKSSFSEENIIQMDNTSNLSSKEIILPSKSNDLAKDDEIILNKIKDKWIKILEKLENSPDYAHLYSFLTSGKGAWPLEIEQNLLTIAFWEKDELASISFSVIDNENNKKILSEIIYSICQKNLEIKFILTSKIPPKKQLKTKSPLKGDKDPNQLFNGNEESLENNPFD